jgi:hypothetical protein
MEELQALGLCHLNSGKKSFLYQKIINIHDNGVIALVDTNPMSQKNTEIEVRMKK